MKSSNLALRMDTDAGDAGPGAEPAHRKSAVRAFEVRAFDVRGFELRAFDTRAIVLREPGLGRFLVR